MGGEGGVKEDILRGYVNVVEEGLLGDTRFGERVARGDEGGGLAMSRVRGRLEGVYILRWWCRPRCEVFARVCCERPMDVVVC